MEGSSGASCRSTGINNVPFFFSDKTGRCMAESKCGRDLCKCSEELAYGLKSLYDAGVAYTFDATCDAESAATSTQGHACQARSTDAGGVSDWSLFNPATQVCANGV